MPAADDCTTPEVDPALETDNPAQEPLSPEQQAAIEKADAEADKWDKIDIGTEVLIGPGFTGQILAFMAFDSYVRYRVAWWDDKKRHVAWLDPCELEVKKPDEGTEFGFHCKHEASKESAEEQA